MFVFVKVGEKAIMKELETFEMLCSYCKAFIQRECYRNSDTFFERIAMNPNDTHIVEKMEWGIWGPTYERVRVKRDISIYKDGKYFDIRLYKDEVLNATPCWYGKPWSRNPGHGWDGYKDMPDAHVRYKHFAKQRADEEELQREFGMNPTIHREDIIWGGHYYGAQTRQWKRQTKCRKQWGRNAKANIGRKDIEVARGHVYDPEMVEEFEE